MGLNHFKLSSYFLAHRIKRVGSDAAEQDTSLSSDAKLAGLGSRSKVFASQVHPMHGQLPMSSDSGSDSSSDKGGNPVKPAGIIRSGVSSIYADHALAMSMLGPELEFGTITWDYHASLELIDERSRELTGSHRRTTLPIAAQDLRSSTGDHQSEAPSSKGSEEALGGDRCPAKDMTSSRIEAAVDSISKKKTKRRPVGLVDYPVSRPPPCSQCSSAPHSDDCNALRRFSADELWEMTNGYNAHNGFAYQHDHLFKGFLDGQRVYVVRRQPHERAKVCSEVDVLQSLKHPNIVTLLGYCDAENHLAVVFGFVCNRTLSFHLDTKNFKILLWPLRANLAVEVAKGLVYLHNNSIIHGNVNAMYLFLHRDFRPVIAQFCLARKVAEGQDAIVEDRTKDKKSRGYLAPEYEVGGTLSMQEDVYAFGVVLFELISGHRASYRRTNKFLGEWCRDTVEGAQATGRCDFLSTMVDLRLQGTDFDECDVLRMIKVAALCTKKDPSERPLMTEVLEMLTVDIEDTLAPDSSDESDGQGADDLEAGVIPDGSHGQPMMNGQTEIEASEAPEHHDACNRQVHWANPLSTAKSNELKRGLPLSDMAGKLLRELRAACELLTRVPLRPNKSQRANTHEFPSFNYYQARILRLQMVSSQTSPAKGNTKRPPTPGHPLHKSRSSAGGLHFYRPNGDSSEEPRPRSVSSLATLGELPMSPEQYDVIVQFYEGTASGDNSARGHRLRGKLDNAKDWQ